MTKRDGNGRHIQSPAEAFSERLKQVRQKRGLSQEKLAKRLQEIDYPLSRETLAKIEAGGTRAENVTLNEVLALAFALGVPPVQMMASHGRDSRLRIAGRVPPAASEIARGWIAGRWTLADEDPALFHLELPPDEIRDLEKEAREVTPGQPTSVAAFMLRQALIQSGEAERIFPTENEGDEGQ